MKINRLETHDRWQHLMQDQAINLAKGAEDCLKRNSLSLALQEKSSYVYLYAHPRTADDGVTKRMLWQPRLSKPKPTPNSYLFRAISKKDILEICWMLPPKEMWQQYNKGNVTEHEFVLWSIGQYKYHLEELSYPEPDDLSDEIGAKIYDAIRIEMRADDLREKLFRPEILAASSAPLLLMP